MKKRESHLVRLLTSINGEYVMKNVFRLFKERSELRNEIRQYEKLMKELTYHNHIESKQEEIRYLRSFFNLLQWYQKNQIFSCKQKK